MEITKTQTGNTLEVKVTGRLDGYWANHLVQTLGEMIREGAHRIRLDMVDVGYLSSAGIGVLVQKSADQVIKLSDAIILRDKLTTLMVTHSMQQAVSFGDRLVMMHRGRIIHDFSGSEKKRLRVEDLLARFEAVRRADLLDEDAALLLKRSYV